MDILKEYLALCWLNNDPLELPRSVGLFKKNLLIYFVVGYLLQANMIDDPFESFYEISLQIILMLAFISIMLFFNKTLYVLVQITTAFIFSANIISAFVRTCYGVVDSHRRHLQLLSVFCVVGLVLRDCLLHHQTHLGY